MRNFPPALAATALALVMSVGVHGLATLPDAPDTDLAIEAPGAKIHTEILRAAHTLGIDPAPLELGPCPTYEHAILDHFWYLDAEPPAQIPSLGDAELEGHIACVLDAMLHANMARDTAFAGTDWDALAPYLMRDDPDLMNEVPLLELDIAIGSALALAERIDALLTQLHADPTPAYDAGGPYAAPEIDLEPVLAVDRLGNTFYDLDYALVIDRAGNDLYDNNAGGGMIAFGGGPFIDPTGDRDTWQHPIAPMGYGSPHVVVGGEFEDSEAIISAALAIDSDGDDTYGTYKVAGRDGFCTAEKVVRRVLQQGAAVAGPAMLIDTAGDNDLRARVLAQGLGHVGGLGVLYLGPGDDHLVAVRSSQGSGVFNGIGLLINEDGDDTYEAYPPPGGTLNADLGICDEESRYVQGSGFGRGTGGGTGVIGILRREGGNDIYRSDIKSQGFGMVNGIGVLVELGGNDRYEGLKKTAGWAEGHHSTGGPGWALFYEADGDDTYAIGAAPALGAGGGSIGDPNDIPDPYIPPTLWVNEIVGLMVDPLLTQGNALALDAGGDDVYSLSDRGNDRTVIGDGIVGIFTDGEY